MPKLIVKDAVHGHSLFQLPVGETLIGRGDHCQLVLPNVSVSRENSRILMGRQGVSIEDLESSNGTVVNGKKLDQAPLKSGDEIQIGRFGMVYLTDTEEDRFYRGRYIAYLPAYKPRRSEGGEDSTFAMDQQALEKLAASHRLVETARLILARDDKQFWYPEDRELTFGNNAAMIRIKGFLVWGKVARVFWDGAKHVLESNSLFTSASVNGAQVNRRPLRHGDRVRIGKTLFRYDAPESKSMDKRAGLINVVQKR